MGIDKYIVLLYTLGKPMHKIEMSKQGLMRISEIARAAGVSLPTIHYYIREGLLSPSLKTAQNMAYYSPDCIDEIRLIKELQTKKYLPLSVIKLIIQAKHEGQDINHIAEMESFLGGIFRPLDDELVPKKMSLAELISSCGLSESEIKELESMGLLVPRKTDQEIFYDDIDIHIVKIFKDLKNYGIKPQNLDVYRQYIEVIHTEAQAMHATIHQLPDHEKVPLQELIKISSDLKRYLAMRVYRQEAQHFHEHSFLREEEK
jgi:DNA-binding transcriptional MerR regulator